MLGDPAEECRSCTAAVPATIPFLFASEIRAAREPALIEPTRMSHRTVRRFRVSNNRLSISLRAVLRSLLAVQPGLGEPVGLFPVAADCLRESCCHPGCHQTEARPGRCVEHLLVSSTSRPGCVRCLPASSSVCLWSSRIDELIVQQPGMFPERHPRQLLYPPPAFLRRTARLERCTGRTALSRLRRPPLSG